MEELCRRVGAEYTVPPALQPLHPTLESICAALPEAARRAAEAHASSYHHVRDKIYSELEASASVMRWRWTEVLERGFDLTAKEDETALELVERIALAATPDVGTPQVRVSPGPVSCFLRAS